jgi:hypothetical protein
VPNDRSPWPSGNGFGQWARSACTWSASADGTGRIARMTCKTTGTPPTRQADAVRWHARRASPAWCAARGPQATQNGREYPAMTRDTFESGTSEGCCAHLARVSVASGCYSRAEPVSPGSSARARIRVTGGRSRPTCRAHQRHAATEFARTMTSC